MVKRIYGREILQTIYNDHNAPPTWIIWIWITGTDEWKNIIRSRKCQWWSGESTTFYILMEFRSWFFTNFIYNYEGFSFKLNHNLFRNSTTLPVTTQIWVFIMCAELIKSFHCETLNWNYIPQRPAVILYTKKMK